MNKARIIACLAFIGGGVYSIVFGFKGLKDR